MIFAVVLRVYSTYYMCVFDIDIDAPINFNSLFATSALMKNFVLRFISLIVSNLFESCFRWLLAVFVFYRQWVPRWKQQQNQQRQPLHRSGSTGNSGRGDWLDIVWNSNLQFPSGNYKSKFLALVFFPLLLFFSLFHILFFIFIFISVAVSVYLFVCTEKNSKQNRNERQT